MTQPMHMWTYWRDKKGMEEALEDYYPDRLQADPELQLAVYQIHAARALIEAKMSALTDKEEGDENHPM